MKFYKRLEFKSWAQRDFNERAIGICDGNYFEVAINCRRDSDMGHLDSDGVYSREWVSDEINPDLWDYDIRPASPEEIGKFLRHIDLGEDHLFVEAETPFVLYKIEMPHKYSIHAE